MLLIERLFKVKKNGVFLFGISFFVMEIFTFLYYANEESDDVIGGFTKTVQHSRTWHQNCTSQNKQNDTCHIVAMTTVLPLVLLLLRLKFPDVILNKDHSNAIN